jgi:hypothetical protein
MTSWFPLHRVSRIAPDIFISQEYCQLLGVGQEVIVLPRECMTLGQLPTADQVVEAIFRLQHLLNRDADSRCDEWVF